MTAPEARDQDLLGLASGDGLHRLSRREFGKHLAEPVGGPSAYTRRTLGWEPTHPSLLADLENIEP